MCGWTWVLIIQLRSSSLPNSPLLSLVLNRLKDKSHFNVVYFSLIFSSQRYWLCLFLQSKIICLFFICCLAMCLSFNVSDFRTGYVVYVVISPLYTEWESQYLFYLLCVYWEIQVRGAVCVLTSLLGLQKPENCIKHWMKSIDIKKKKVGWEGKETLVKRFWAK